jgi:hypothetical protein
MSYAAIIAAAAAAVAGAGAKYAGQRQQAKGMWPEEYERELADLKARQRVGQLGFTEEELGRREAKDQATRAGAVADARAAGRQTAQSMAATGAIGGRELFLQEQAVQEGMAIAADKSAIRIAEENERREDINRDMIRQLAQREASAEAAKKGAKWTALGDIFKIGGTIGASIWGSNAEAAAQQDLVDAQATGDPKAIAAAESDIQSAQMGMRAAGAYGYVAPVQPAAAPTATTPATTPAAAPTEPVPTPGASGARTAPVVQPYDYSAQIAALPELEQPAWGVPERVMVGIDENGLPIYEYRPRGM